MFNFEAVRQWRGERGLTTKEIAEYLYITEDYWYKMEEGKRQPGSELLKHISELTGISMEILMDPGQRIPPLPKNRTNLYNILSLWEKLDQERALRIGSEMDALQAGRAIETILAVCSLQKKYLAVVLRLVPESDALTDTTRKCAVEAAKEGKLDFLTISSVLKVRQRTLNQWLGTGKSLYKCPFALYEPVLLPSREAAGLAFSCFDCVHRDFGECRGYGKNNHPESVFELIEQLKKSGIVDKKEQREFIKKHYGFSLKALSKRREKGQNASPQADSKDDSQEAG